ncbi:MAG: zinc-dependent metalloprotease, partial [Rubrivivax sp.]
TLGLRHNFRSSRIYSDQQLSDEAFTRANSLAGSVMEYAPINLPRPGQKGGTAWQLALGPYDFWAIEYAYKPIDPKAEVAELQRIAARNAERELAYGTDEDNGLGIDPETLVFDLGDDPVAFAKKRFEIGRDLITRQETRVLKPEEDYSVLRRSVTYAVRDMGRAAGILARQIGGVRTLRDHPGTGRDPLQPVPAAVQREALEALSRGVMSADSLKLSPAMQRKLAPSFDERTDAAFGDTPPVETDFSIDTFVTQLRKALLAQLTSDGVASRLLDSVTKLPPGEAFPLSELYARLRADIWSELASSADIAPARRELQREHLNRIAGQILRPTAARADTRSLMRAEALALQKNLKAAAARPQWNAEVRAHLQDSLDLLTEALAAKMQRAGL